MSAHTPGPWLAEPSSDGRSWIVTAPDPSEYAATDERTIVADNLTEANARLIAAAPDLLEAAKRGLGYLVSDYENTRGGFGAASEDVALIRAAIAKAEGR